MEIGGEVKPIMSGITVECLKNISFSLLPLPEKLEIISRGRPTPNIFIPSTRITKTKKFLKSFNQDWYEKVEWLCGCEATNALFCFPCLLFGGDTVWTQNGFTNISKMKEKTEKHQNSRRHMANVISLSLLGQINGPEQLGETSELLRNEKQVKEYQEDLLKIVECLKFSSKFELSLGHSGSEFFKNLQHLVSYFDPAIRNHLLVFGETSEAIQNDLLQHMLDTCREQIVSEIEEASCVSLICEDVSDVSENIQTIIVFRYEFRGVVHERFWGFLDSESVRRDGLCNCLLRELTRVLKKDWHKLIAQTFGGPVKGESQKIQSVYHNAHFIHVYSHNFDLTLKHMTSFIKPVRMFFANLANLDKFLKKSQIRLAILYEHISGSIPPFKSLDVGTVYRIRSDLIKTFEDLVSHKATDETLQASDWFLSILKSEDFLFWLEIFHKIILNLELLYQDIQTMNPDDIPQTVFEFCKLINKVCNSVSFGSSGSSRILECQELSDCIRDEIKERFAFTGHLSAAKLFDGENFERFNLELPRVDIRETCQAYPDIMQEKLIMELRVFYSQKKFQNLGILDILNMLNNESLSGVFSETIKLLKILVTIPVGLTQSEVCYSTLTKVKSCITDALSREKLTACCMLTVENEMVSQTNNFNEKVVKSYCENRKLEFGII